MYAIRNKRTGKWLYGTDYRYPYHYHMAGHERPSRRQRTSNERVITWETRQQAEIELVTRRCGKDYEVVPVKLEAIE